MELDYTWSSNAFEYSARYADRSALTAALKIGAVDPFVDTIKYPINFAPYLDSQLSSGASTLNDLAVRASGAIFPLPWGNPTFTIGLEHRKEGTGDNNYYSIFTANPSNNNDSITFGNSESTNSAYAEANIPIVSSKNAFLGVHSLEIQMAIRSEEYTVGTGNAGYTEYPNNPTYNYYSGTTSADGLPYHSETKYTATKPTIGLSYKPVDDFILRASWSEAFLPPTYSQLTNNPVPQQTYGATIVDPKTGQNNDTYEEVQNFNSDLKPQSSRNWDFGVIWEPKAELLKGLRLDFEFFQIKEFNVISSPPNDQFVVNNYPSRITRDPTTGVITLVDNSYINLYELETEGYDLSLDYRKATPFGTFDLYAIGTVQEHYKQQLSLNQPLLEYVGFPSEGGPEKIKENTTLTWSYGHWTLGWTTLFFGAYNQYGAPGDPNGTSTHWTVPQGGNTIPSQLVHDIVASYAFGNISDKHGKILQSLASRWTVQVGVKNLFNTAPPFDAFYGPYYYSPYGDPRLRDLWVSIKHDF
jgi:outer membrane receptor protein involved in Fe transport